MERVRVGAIGTGGIFYGWGGGSGHLLGYAWAEEAKLTALCDPNEVALRKAEAATRAFFARKAEEAEAAGNGERAEALRRDAEELQAYTSLEDLLATARVDAVDVISPAETHAPVCLQALGAGKHVLCEKPMTRTWLEAAQVVEAVEESGRIFQYAENLIFSDPWPVFRNCLDAGMIGELLLLYLPLAIGGPGNYSYTRGGVGALLDMAIHAITLSWYLAGFDRTPVRVKAASPHGIALRMPSRQENGVERALDMEDDAHLLVEYEGAGGWCTAHVEGSWSYRDSPETQALGTTGSLTPEGSGVKVTDAFGGTRVCVPFHPSFLNAAPPPDHSGYAQQIRGFCHAILHGGKPSCDARVGAESMAIAGAALLSQARGRAPVSLDEFKEYARGFERRLGEDANDALLAALREGIRRPQGSQCKVSS